MRSVLVAAVALVIGAVLGWLPDRLEKRALEDQLEHAQAGDCKRGVGRELATMFQGRPPVPETEAGGRGDRAPVADPEPVPDVDTDEEADTDGDVEIRVGPPERIERPEVNPDDLALARDALELRRTQAREALIQDAGPSDEQLAEIDDAVATMNDHLEGLAEDLVDMLNETDGDVDRRRMMLFAEEALGVLNEGEDGIRAALDDEQLGWVDDGSLDPFSHIDPALIDLFMQLDR